ncbi:MAG TPA: alpha/beta hydrolase [Longimicrobiales bacterium]|nr:alpha/beta hydrolase [Longimicrobiales bacterium]
MAFTLPLHVETQGLAQGDGVDTFVLLHGYGGSSFSWRVWAPALARRGHVVLVDLKGFGSAPKPDDGAYAPRDHAELVHRLVLQRDLRRVTLVGHSLGGGIALLTALRLLDDGAGRLHRMVIVAGAAYPQRLPPFVALAKRRRVAGALLRLVGARRVVRFVLRNIVYRPEDVTRSQVEGYADPLSTPEARAALISTALQIQPPDLAGVVRRYPEIDVPALLMWGRQDRVVPLSVGEALSRALPQGRLVVLEECGHLPAEELPAKSVEVLETFLRGGTPDAPAS